MIQIRKMTKCVAGLLMAVTTLLWSAGLPAQFIQTTNLGGPGGGFAVSEKTVGVDECGGGTGTAVDPTNPNAFYTYDGIAIRRSVFGGVALGEVVFTPPAAINVQNFQGGVYGSLLVFNPNNSNELWFAESSDRHLYVITLASGSRTQVSASRVAYTSAPGFNIYDIAFDTSTANLLVVASEGNFAVNNFIRIEPNAGTFNVSQIGSVSGASGPVTFDPVGNFYYVIPPFSGAGPLAADEAKLIRWTASTVGSALQVAGTPLSEANADATAERIFTFNSTPGIFPSIAGIAARIEGGRPIIYAGNNDPQNAPDATVTGGIMRIDIEQAASNDNHFWARIQGNAVPGKLAAINRAAEFSANAGQWDEMTNQPNGRLYALMTFFGDVCFGAATVNSAGSIAMIVPNNTAAEIENIVVISHPASEYVLQPIQPVLEIRDAGGHVITSGAAIGLPVSVAVLTGPAGGALTGTIAGSISAGGRATFGAGFQLGTVGAYTLVYTIGGQNVQQTINITRIASIGVVSFPNSVVINTPFNASVELLDDNGTRLTGGIGASANVVISIQTGPNGESINQSVAAVNGLAEFSNLQVGTVGSYSFSFNAFIGAISQAQTNVPLEVQPVVLLSTGGSSCTAAIGGGAGRGILPVLAILMALGGLLVSMRRRAINRSA
jgi:hypothetical protein